ncbi:hypothetical protein ACISU4_23310 [Streptomyces wuyuanensis]|uniref:hypothetical protein n=1 Tax=Streptomyces wuyuanensis TaxID=1196353 RepID=UPI00381F55B5
MAHGALQRAAGLTLRQHFVDGNGYAFMAEESGAKHRIHLSVGIPRTVDQLTERHPEALDAFLTTTALREDPDDPMGVVRACEQLPAFGGLPPPRPTSAGSSSTGTCCSATPWPPKPAAPTASRRRPGGSRNPGNPC